MRTTVVYVHGLWMSGVEGTLLRRRLAKSLNADAPFFRYRSVAAGISLNALSLAKKLSKLQADTLHLVGHSLGGLVILKLFADGAGATLPPGRVVLLGSPVGGSRAATSLASWKYGNAILGKSVRETLLTANKPRWTEPRELGVIAGSMNVGLGRVVNTLQAPSDGTVFVDETEIIGMRSRIVMPVSHTGLPFSIAVARETATFLRTGEFGRR
jgi:pimeloyl-ACP methyl ester carboxylesterase